MGEDLENNTEVAAWYYLNVLDGQSCVESVFTQEDFKAVKEVKDPQRMIDQWCAIMYRLPLRKGSR